MGFETEAYVLTFFGLIISESAFRLSNDSTLICPWPATACDRVPLLETMGFGRTEIQSILGSSIGLPDSTVYPEDLHHELDKCMPEEDG